MKDPVQAVVSGAQVTLTDQRTKGTITVVPTARASTCFRCFNRAPTLSRSKERVSKAITSPELKVAQERRSTSISRLRSRGYGQTVNVTGRCRECLSRRECRCRRAAWDNADSELPFSVNVISRQLIDDTQSRNVKQAAKYLPLASFQEMQGPEVIRPETRGMQGSNMQNARKDGMGIAVTTPSALEEYEQIEVVSGLGRPVVWSNQPFGRFQFRNETSNRGAVS